MNELDIMEAVGSLDPELIKNAAAPKKKLTGRWLIAASAAAAALALGLTAIVRGAKKAPEGGSVEAAAPTASATVSPQEEAECYVAYFKYKGSIYICNESYYGADEIVGERLAGITNKVDPGTAFDEAPELSGSFACDIYAVKGFDPEIMICTVDGGFASVYVNVDKSRFRTGADILEGAFHVSEYLTSLVYEGSDSLDHGYSERYVLDTDCMPAARELIRVLDEGEWIGPTEGKDAVFGPYEGPERYALTLSLGFYELRLTVLADGRAIVHPLGGGWMEYYLSFDAEKAEPFFELLRSGEHGSPAVPSDQLVFLRPEELNAEPHFGAYFPETPEGYEIEYAILLYETDETTAAIIPDRVKRITAEYRMKGDPNRSFKITVRAAEELKDELLGVDAAKRCDAPIGALDENSVKSGSAGFYEVTGYDENAAVTINAYSSLTPSEMAELMHECFGR